MLFCNTDKMSQSILKKFFLKAYCEKINNAELYSVILPEYS